MNNSYIYLLKTSWKYALNEHRKYILVYFLLVLSNIFISLRPVIYGWFINSLQVKGSNVFKDMWLYILLYMGIFFLQWLVHGPARVMERSLAFKIGSNFQDDLYNKVLHLPIDWHKENHSSSTLNRIKKSSNSLRDFFQNGFLYLQTIIQLLLSLLAMIYFSPLFGFIAAVVGIVTIIVIFLFDKPLIRSLQEFNEGDHKLSSTLTDSLTNIVTVITLRLERQMQSEVLKKVADMFVPFKRNILIGERKWFTAGLLVTFIYCIMIIGYLYQNFKPGQTFYIGGLVTLIGFVTQFTNVFFNIASQYNQIIQYNADVQSASVIKTAYDARFINSKFEAIPPGWNVMEIKNINFEYAKGAETAILNKNETGIKSWSGLVNNQLKLINGQKIALTGTSGSGKSTLLALLKGLHLPLDGYVITVDGHYDYKWQQLTESVTLFPQQPEIFENTIYYNITMGLSYSDEEVMSACNASCFADVINQLPEGLNSVIKENGINLSGGQKQRLALARGILASKNSSIILMDEPTSNIDQETELEIYSNLFIMFKQKIVISSLHRIHLLKLFDEAYSMDKGTLLRKPL